MSFIAKHIVFLRGPDGQRVEIPPRRRLPEWVRDADIAALLAASAIEQEKVAVPSAMTRQKQATEAQNADFAAAADALSQPVVYEDGEAKLKAQVDAAYAPISQAQEAAMREAAPADEAKPAPAKKTTSRSK